MFLNGSIVGVKKNPHQFVNRLKKYRRMGKINEFISVSYSERTKVINISCDYGRLTRPYIIVENGRSKLLKHHIAKIVSIQNQIIDPLTHPRKKMKSHSQTLSPKE